VEENLAESSPEPMPAERVQVSELRPQKGLRSAILLGALVIAIAILTSGWITRRMGAISFDKPYQAVLLSNGQVYYGRLEGYGTNQPVLREVYYIQAQTNQETHQQTNILLKRGKEWHSPDRMYINPSQIILVEPVGTESKVSDLIRQMKSQ
jgi:hypothetical protein